MSLLQRILGTLYFFAGMVLFAVTLLIVVIPILIANQFSEPRKSKIVHRSFKIWMSVLLPLVACPVRRKGKRHFKAGQNYVIVANHNSLVDILVSVPWIPGPSKTLAKVELSRIPVFGIIYRSGSILVDRNSEGSRKESFTKMQQALKTGLHLCLYPEGTRNQTGQLLAPFFDGAFITAIRAQKPIVPAVIFGTKKILPLKPKFWARPHPIHIHFLPPVPTEGMSLRDRDVLKDQVYGLMENYLKENEQLNR